MKKKKVRCGVIGLGFIGTRVHVPSLRGIKGAKLVAVADLEEKRVKKAAKRGAKGYHDYKEVLENPDIDAVWVCLPNFLHAKVTLEALEAGKHVFCEMPLSNKVEEAKEVVSKSKEVDRFAVPGATFRYTPNFNKMKKLMDSGEVGKPTMFYGREYIAPSILADQWPAGSWAWDKEKSGGTSFTLSVWAIDLMRWLTESEVKRVYASIQQIEQPEYGGVTPENCQLHLNFENGVSGVLERSENSPRSMEGSELRMLFDDNRAIYAKENDIIELHQEEYDKRVWKFFSTGTRVWGHQQLDRHFVNCIRKDQTPSVTAVDGLRGVEIATAMVESADTGRAIEL